MPFGFGLAAILDRRGWSRGCIRWVVLICGFLLTLTVESLQQFLPLRQPSVADLVGNTLGALAGLLTFRVWQNREAVGGWLREKLEVPRNLMAAIVLYTLVLLLIANGLATSVRFFKWEADYRMLLGNEQTEDRLWRGIIRDLAIYDRALDSADARRLLVDPALISSDDSDLLAYYPLAGENLGIEEDATGQQPYLIWRGVEQAEVAGKPARFDGGWLESILSVSDLSDALLESSQLTIRLTVATADLDQTGPARIVTISEDSLLRSLTLGQDGRDLTFRFRSFLTGENGTTPQFNFANVFTGTDPQAIVITYDGLNIELIDSQSELSITAELLPGIAFFFLYMSPVLNMNPGFSQITANARTSWAFHLLFYLIVFLPLGILLTLPVLQSWDRTRRFVLLLGCLVVVPLLLELVLVLPSGSSVRPLYVAAGAAVIGISTFVLVPASRFLVDSVSDRAQL
jgi:glycopeptide antibiotics resistance protein